MDYLHPRPLRAHLASVRDGDDGDEVLLSKTLWDSLNLDERRASKAAVAISRASHSSRHANKTVASLIAYASLDDKAAGLVVPKRWLEQHSVLFTASDLSSQAKEPTHNLVVVQPMPLSEVILTAHTNEAYELSLVHRPAFEEYFFDERRILRQDSVYHLTTHDLGLSEEHSTAHQYRLVMTSPVLQGCAKRGQTQLYVISLPPPATSANGFAHSEPGLDDLQEIPSDEEDVGDSEDGFEIDEAFLAGSVLHPVPNTEQSATVETSGIDGHRINSSVYTRRAEPLSSPRSSVDDDCTVYIPTAELGQIGVLSGDWVRVEFERIPDGWWRGSSGKISRERGVSSCPGSTGR